MTPLARYAAIAVGVDAQQPAIDLVVVLADSGAGVRIELGVADSRGATFCMRSVPKCGCEVLTMASRAAK